MHARAEHILAKNPSMPKSEAFAIATQQSHALGKSPKGYGTAEGRHTAKAKFDTPKDDKKTANPGGLTTPRLKHAASALSPHDRATGLMNTEQLRAFADELEKIARVATALLPHQQRVVDRIQQTNQPGLVVVHGLGSGKTLSAIAAQDALNMPATVVLPAALRENYQKEQRKHLEGEPPDTTFSTVQTAARRGTLPSNPLLIVDEAHRLRETATKGSKAVADTPAKKRLLMTGSPFYNRPDDLSPLVNIAAGEHLLPADERAFAGKYMRTRQVNPGFIDRHLRGMQPGEIEELNPQRAAELANIYKKWVDYHPGSTENFPTVTHEDVRVPMTRKQLAVYDGLDAAAPAWVKEKVKRGLPPSKAESQDINAFINAHRQVTNSTAPFTPGQQAQEPKIDAAFGRLKKMLDENERAKGVVYSNFLPSGINPYKQRLQAAGIPFGEFTGEMKDKERQQLVKDYNENKIRALLLSSAGGEGLDLKGTRLMQVLEPHWNAEKIHQVVGRGARFKSHEGLAPEEQKMLVEHYLAERPKSLFNRMGIGNPGYSADEYLSMRSREKENLINQFKNLLPKQNMQPGATA